MRADRGHVYTCRARAWEDGKTEDARVVLAGSCAERTKNVTGEFRGAG